MELTSMLPTAIFVATIATVVLAVLSYVAFKVREWRRPRSEAAAPVFFRRYRPPEPASEKPPAG